MRGSAIAVAIMPGKPVCPAATWTSCSWTLTPKSPKKKTTEKLYFGEPIVGSSGTDWALSPEELAPEGAMEKENIGTSSASLSIAPGAGVVPTMPVTPLC